MANVFGDAASGLTDQIFSSIFWFGLIGFAMVLLGGAMWYFLIYKRKFDITVKIISERSEDRNTIIFDRAAVLIHRKSGSKYLRLWITKVDLPLPKFNVMQHTRRGDYLEVYRDSEDSFFYLTPTVVDKQYMIKSDGALVPIADQHSRKVDTDMSYWIAKRKDMNKKMFDVEHWFMKMLPFIPHIITGVLVIFILYILLDHLPGILGELRQLTQALNQQQTAQITTFNAG